MEDALRQVQKQFDSDKSANPPPARCPRSWFEHTLDFTKGGTWAVTIGPSEASDGWQFCASKTYGQTDSSEEVRKVFQLDRGSRSRSTAVSNSRRVYRRCIGGRAKRGNSDS